MDGEGKAVSGAAVECVFRLPGTRRALRRQASVGGDGSFRVGGLPPGRVVLTVRSPGFAVLRRELEVDSEGVRALRLVLEAARRVEVRVVDGGGEPLAGVIARMEDGTVVAESDPSGRLVLEDVPAGEFVVTLDAKGFVPLELVVPRELESPLRAVLEPAAGLRAVFRFEDTGEPAGPGRVTWERERFTGEPGELPADGVLELDDRPPGRWRMTVSPEGGVPVTFENLVLEGGAVLDLGEVPVRRGLAVEGTVLDDLTGAPMEGADVRLLLPGRAGGPRLAVLLERFATARTGTDGRFTVAGLEAGRYPMLVEAPGRAPLLVEGLELSEDLSGGVLKLDPLWLVAAHRLVVRCRPEERCGGTASLLLGSPVNDWAAVEGRMVGGEAVLDPVPPGGRTMRLLDGGWIVTEREVTVARDRDRTVVEIDLSGTRVLGTVLVGDRPAEGGRVTFTPGGGGHGVPEVLVDSRLPGGSSPDQRVFTDRGRSVHGAVEADGSFVLEDVPPGEYQVVYTTTAGRRFPGKGVTVPEDGEFTVVLQYRGGGLTGLVVGPDGQPPAAASVTVVDAAGATATVPCDAGGGFAVEGLAPGEAVATARAVEGTGRAHVVVEEEDTATVRIELEEPEAVLEVEVSDRDGRPVAGALVAAAGPGGLETRWSDTDGRVTFTSSWLAEAPALLGAGRPGLGFSFGSGGGEAGSAVVRLFLGGGGMLEVVNEGPLEGVRIVAPGGFPVERLLPLVGIPPAVGSGAPLVLTGLPPGSYRAGSAAGPLTEIRVRSGELATVVLSRGE